MKNISLSPVRLTAKNKMKPSLRLTLKKIEKEIKNKDVEVGYFVDKQGNIKHRVEGSADQIQIPPSLEKELKGCCFTHNHPMEKKAVLSVNDIESALCSDLMEVRCVSNKGEIAALKLPNLTLKQGLKLECGITKTNIKNIPRFIGLLGKKLALKAKVKLGLLDNEFAKNLYFDSIEKINDVYKNDVEKFLKKAANLTVKYMKV